MKLEMEFRNDGEITIIDLKGRMRAGTDIVDFRRAVKRLADEGRMSVVVNLKDVGRVDSSGLGELIAGYSTMERSGGKLKLLNLNDSVVELMMMTKLLTVFEVFEDETEAIQSFGTESGSPEIKQAAAAGTSGENATVQ